MDMDDQAPLTTSDELTDAQVKAMYVLQSFSGSLSVIGSTLIVYKILRDRAQIGRILPYDRIILGLSITDIFSSITALIDQYLFPRGTYAWAFGNSSTCVAAGFLAQFSVAWSINYNCVLSYYFLLTALSQLRQKNIVAKFEVWLHIYTLYAPITAFIGLGLGWFDKDDPCYIDPSIGWIIAGIPTLFTYLSLIMNNIVIYILVQKSLGSAENIPSLSSTRKKLRREAATLMFLYIGCYFVAITPIFIIHVLNAYFGYGQENYGKIYLLWLLYSIFFPLQGFFNVFIYLRPAFTRFRAVYPHKPICFVAHQALFNPNIPQTNSASTMSIIPDHPNEALFSTEFGVPASTNRRRRSSSSGSSSSSSSSSDSSASSNSSE